MIIKSSRTLPVFSLVFLTIIFAVIATVDINDSDNVTYLTHPLIKDTSIIPPVFATNNPEINMKTLGVFSNGSIDVEALTSEPISEQKMLSTIRFLDTSNGNLIKDVNYDIAAIQNNNYVLCEPNTYTSNEEGNHETTPLNFNFHPVQMQIMIKSIGSGQSIQHVQDEITELIISPKFVVVIVPEDYTLLNKISDCITVTTDKTSYKFGDKIKISGNVGEILQNVPINLQITDVEENIIFNQSFSITPNMKFSGEIIPDKEIWKYTGIYTVKVEYGHTDDRRSNNSLFYFDTHVSPMPTPEPEPTCEAGTELVNGICQVIKTAEPKEIKNEYGILIINQDTFQVVKYTDPELLVISGIHEKYSRGEKMTIGISLPDGTTENHELTVADKGKYHFTLELTSDFKAGSYSVVVDPNGHAIGPLTFSIV